jgi:3-oxoadipate enol-lactonase/4-carboxymuconolactone decarboxylase
LDRGRLFLFVHDAGGNAGVWRPQLEAFGRRHSALAVDLPGHGRSSGLDGLPDPAAYAAFLESFADALSLRPLVLVGCGLGGAIAVLLALRAPARLEGLVLIATPSRFDVPDEVLARCRDVVRGRRPQHFGNEAFSPHTDIEVMKQAWAEQVRTDPRVALGDLEACRRFDGAVAGRVAVPTLVLAGADDRMAPPEDVRALAAAVPGACFEIVERAGHHLALERADAFTASVLSFLGESSGEPAGEPA